MYPNLYNNYVDVVTGGICPYGSDSGRHICLRFVIRRDMNVFAIILSHKIIYYTRLASKIIEIVTLNMPKIIHQIADSV
jgi:hypothetical protein